MQNELKNEKTVLNQIKAVYQRALVDIEAKIEKMQARIMLNAEDTASVLPETVSSGSFKNASIRYSR